MHTLTIRFFVSFLTILLAAPILLQQAVADDHGLPDDVKRRAQLVIEKNFILNLAKMSPGDSFTLTLFEDVTVNAATQRVSEKNGILSWFGNDSDFEIGDVIITADEESLLATFYRDTREYTIHQISEGSYVVDELAPLGLEEELGEAVRLPEDLENIRYPLIDDNPQLSASMFTRDAALFENMTFRIPENIPEIVAQKFIEKDQWLFPEDGSRIDLLVGITLKAHNHLSSQGTAVILEINHAVNVANGIFTGSGINTQLNLVKVQLVEYEETIPNPTAKDPDPPDKRGEYSLFTELFQLHPSAYYSQEPIHSDLQLLDQLRDDYGADLVTLLVYLPGRPPDTHFAVARGKAHLLFAIADPLDNLIKQGGVGKGSFKGFNVVNTRFKKWKESFAHEIGHNLGANHDLFALLSSGDNPGSIVGAFGHVALNPIGGHQPFYTLMATGALCIELEKKDCGRLHRFSDPNATYYGEPTGTESGILVEYTNNSSVLNLTRGTVANFRHQFFFQPPSQ
jgi:hypothetical protein